MQTAHPACTALSPFFFGTVRILVSIVFPAVRAYAHSWGIDHGQGASFVLVGCQTFLAEKWVLLHRVTFTADVIRRLAALSALERQRQIPSQQTDSLALFGTGHRMQKRNPKLCRTAEIILVEENGTGRNALELCTLPYLHPAALIKCAHMPTALKPDLSQKSIQRFERGSQRHIEVQPIHLILGVLHLKEDTFLVLRLLPARMSGGKMLQKTRFCNDCATEIAMPFCHLTFHTTPALSSLR